MKNNPTVAIMGLGYVGLPLAVCFAKRYRVIGFDVSENRIRSLTEGHDNTREIDESVLLATSIQFTLDPEDLKGADVVIVTVPTPIDEHKRPDLRPLLGASKILGQVMTPGTVVVYESTVYPGATEEECIPVLEGESGLVWMSGFHVGYSPERINPGDKEHTVDKILKVVSGDTAECAEYLSGLYRSVISAGVYTAASIKTAEAAKVIENCQRDINIAFVNELSLIFQRLGLDTAKVLEAAQTKWNFLPFKPGLVGGHCIGVDPYYLTYKAESIGYHSQVILSGRRINDGMGVHVANRVIKLLIGRGILIRGAKVLILGITFKENCPDIRNSRVIDIVNELREYGVQVDVHDPWADSGEVEKEYGFCLVALPTTESRGDRYDAVVHAVAHREFEGLDIAATVAPGGVVYDVKSSLPLELVTERL
jgi:UDP-N-acetyl-D-galactosamine dehydrogenase